MKRLILTTLMALASAPSLSAPLTDPCENAADKIACIETKIDEQSTLIADRIRYLNNTQGPVGVQGPQGLTGPQGITGDKGSKGKTGRDNKTQLDSDYNSRYLALLNRDLNLNTKIFLPTLKLDGIDVENIDQMPRRIADLNRNPDIIGVTPAKRSADNPVWLDFPQDSGGTYLMIFTETYDQRAFTTSIDEAGILNTVFPFGVEPNPDFIDTIADYCTLRPDSAFCGDNVGNLADLRYMESIDLEELEALPEELTVTSGREFSIYKLGMEPDDPAFLMVIDSLLELFETTAFSDGVINNMNDAAAILTTDYTFRSNQLTLLIEGAPSEEAAAPYRDELAALDAEYEANSAAIRIGIDLFTSLASDQYGLRKERLISYINDSDLLYVTLINQAITLYWQYKDNPGSMTDEQLAAWKELEGRFMFFAESFVTQWRNAARQERDLFFQNYVGSNLDGLLGSPSTPDFVDAGAARLGDLYLEKQPATLRDWQTAMAASATAASLVGVTAAGFGVTAGIASAAASGTTAIGLFSAFGATSISSATAALGGAAGAASAAAGPLSILVVAGIAGVMEGIEVFAQGEKDERYEALMNFYVHADDPGSLHNLDLPLEDRKNMINNMLYMWMISNSQVAAE